jgi:hypothetical protein
MADLVLDGARPAFEPGKKGFAWLGPVQLVLQGVVNAVELQTGVRPVPAQHTQGGQVFRGLLEVGETDLTLVVFLGTECRDKQEVVSVPRRPFRLVGGGAFLDDEMGKNPAQNHDGKALVVELDEKDPPRLAILKGAELADGLDLGGFRAFEAEFLRWEVVGEIFNAIPVERPAQLVFEVFHEIVQAADVARAVGHGVEKAGGLDPLGGALDGFPVRKGDGLGEEVSRDVGEGQIPAMDLYPMVVVVAPDLALRFEDRDVDVHLDLRVVVSDPFDGRFEIRIPGNDHEGVRAVFEDIIHEVHGNVHIGLLFLGHGVFQFADTVPGLAGDGALLVFAEDDLHLGERFQRFEIPLLAVPLWADMEFGINEGGEKFDADDFVIEAQCFKEGLEVEPLPGRAMNEYAEVPVESVDIDHGTLAGLY